MINFFVDVAVDDFDVDAVVVGVLVVVVVATVAIVALHNNKNK